MCDDDGYACCYGDLIVIVKVTLPQLTGLMYDDVHVLRVCVIVIVSFHVSCVMDIGYWIFYRMNEVPGTGTV